MAETFDELSPLQQRMAQFSGKQHMAAQELATGAQQKKAADVAGVTPRTIYNWLQVPAFRMLVAEYGFLERFELQVQSNSLIRFALQVVMKALTGEFKPATVTDPRTGRTTLDPASAFAMEKQYDAAKMLVQAVIPSADARLISAGLAGSGTGTAAAAQIDDTMRKLFAELAPEQLAEMKENTAAIEAVVRARDEAMEGWDEGLDIDKIVGLDRQKPDHEGNGKE